MSSAHVNQNSQGRDPRIVEVPGLFEYLSRTEKEYAGLSMREAQSREVGRHPSARVFRVAKRPVSFPLLILVMAYGIGMVIATALA